MGSYHLIGALLLLFVASSRSQENVTANEDATSPIETVPLPSTGSPSVQQLEVATSPIETVPLPSTGSPSVQQLEVETSALPEVTSVPVATEVFTSQEPTTVPNGVVSTTIIPEDFKVTNELSTPASEINSEINDPSTTIDMATIQAKDEVDTSKSPTDDQSTTSPSTTQNETDSRDDKERVAETDRKKDKEENFSTTKHPGQETGNKPDQRYSDKELGKVIIIAAIIFVLIVLLVIMVFFMLRKKKRSGSFRTQSKKNSKRDVWAGQVPELGDGRAAQDLAMAENGRAGTGLETVKEEEMTTFVTGEQKTDSVIEMNELGAGEKATENGGEKLGTGDTAEEKMPLLEEASEEPPKLDEQFPVPPMEQELMANGVQ